MGRLTFVSLISNADDEGRLASDAGHIASTFMVGCPSDEIAVQLGRMEERRMVVSYKHRTARFIAVLDFTGDAPWSQRIDHPKASELPSPPKFKRSGSSNKRQLVLESLANDRDDSRSNGPDRTGSDRTGSDRKPPEGSPAGAVELALVGEVDSVQSLFDAWVESTGHRRAVLTDRRRALIRTRLKEGWSIADLRLVVTEGWRNDPWPERVQHLEFELLLRDSAHVEKFLKLAQDGPPSQKAAPTALDMRTRQLLAEADELRRGGN